MKKIWKLMLVSCSIMTLMGCGTTDTIIKETDISYADDYVEEASSILEQETQKIEEADLNALSSWQIDTFFNANEIDDVIFQRINGKSYHENDVIPVTELRYLRVLYYGADNKTHLGELIVNQSISNDILDIMRTLYDNKYPIEKMVLIDDYDGDDVKSMEDNNTSCFNYRKIAGSSKLSKHSLGMAIDMNPRYNPYVKTLSDGTVECSPENGRDYVDRTKDFPYKIDENDLCYQLFTKHGFTWGGSWKSSKDYQHFEK